MYVISSPHLIQQVHKNPKTLQFGPAASKATARVCGCSEETINILMTNIDLSQGNQSFVNDVTKAIHAALAPGAINYMNRAMAENMSRALDGLHTNDGSSKIKLWQWLQHAITLATSYAAYGPKNPFEDTDVENAFWLVHGIPHSCNTVANDDARMISIADYVFNPRDFKDGILLLLLDIVPSLTAPKAYQGRDVYVTAFEKYFRNGDHENASAVVKARDLFWRTYKLPFKEIARFEIAFSFGILANTVPATFWMLYHVFTRPEILFALQKELHWVLRTTIDFESGVRQHTLNITKLKSECPLLLATFQEALRLYASGSSTRMVLIDTLLNDQYLLRAGSIIQMPAAVVHANPAFWGADADNFNPYRFLRSDSGEKQHPAAFQAWGGGHSLCPGRHFASTEILAVVAVFVLRYELDPVDGVWPLVESKGNLVSGITDPKRDIEVYVSTRKGFEGDVWAYEISDSTNVTATE